MGYDFVFVDCYVFSSVFFVFFFAYFWCLVCDCLNQLVSPLKNILSGGIFRFVLGLRMAWDRNRLATAHS